MNSASHLKSLMGLALASSVIGHSTNLAVFRNWTNRSLDLVGVSGAIICLTLYLTKTSLLPWVLPLTVLSISTMISSAYIGRKTLEGKEYKYPYYVAQGILNFILLIFLIYTSYLYFQHKYYTYKLSPYKRANTKSAIPRVFKSTVPGTFKSTVPGTFKSTVPSPTVINVRPSIKTPSILPPQSSPSLPPLSLPARDIGNFSRIPPLQRLAKIYPEELIERK